MEDTLRSSQRSGHKREEAECWRWKDAAWAKEEILAYNTAAVRSAKWSTQFLIASLLQSDYSIFPSAVLPFVLPSAIEDFDIPTEWKDFKPIVSIKKEHAESTFPRYRTLVRNSYKAPLQRGSCCDDDLPQCPCLPEEICGDECQNRLLYM